MAAVVPVVSWGRDGDSSCPIPPAELTKLLFVWLEVQFAACLRETPFNPFQMATLRERLERVTGTGRPVYFSFMPTETSCPPVKAVYELYRCGSSYERLTNVLSTCVYSIDWILVNHLCGSGDISQVTPN